MARRTAETAEIATLELVSADAQALPAFAPGAHIDVQLPNGLVRQYSLCNDSTQNHRYEIGVLRDPASRGGSLAVHALQPGDMLRISPPKNFFPLVEGPQRTLLLAGGIGVTPMLCMAQFLARTGADFEMRYCTRAPERTAFKSRIEQSAFASRVKFHFDNDPSVPWSMHAVLAAQPCGTHLYVCGPGGFINAALAAAKALQWPDECVHCEFFGVNPVPAGTDQPFSVRLQRSGRVIQVLANQTIVEALGSAGIEIATSCEQGICGTCLTKIIDGEPDHRDSYLTADEKLRNDQLLPCCSRSKSPLLVLDL